MERRASELQASSITIKRPKIKFQGWFWSLRTCSTIKARSLVAQRSGSLAESLVRNDRDRASYLLQHLNVSENALIDLEGTSQLKRLVTLYAQANQLGRVEGYVDENRNRQYDPGETINDESGNGKRDVDPLVELRHFSLVNLHLWEFDSDHKINGGSAQSPGFTSWRK